MNDIIDEHGKVIPPEQRSIMADAYNRLMQLTLFQRGLIFCWFCQDCYEYIPPGGKHNCKVKE